MKKRIVLIGVVAVLSLTAAGAARAADAASPATPSTAIVIENVRIFDGKAATLSPPSNVLVVDNLIRRISTGPVGAPAGLAATRIAGGGRTLIPGLIDNHVHVLISTTSMPDLQAPTMTREIMQSRAEIEARDMLLRGFTTVRDMGGGFLDARVDIDKGLKAGPRIFSSGAMISQTSGHGDARRVDERSRRFFGKPAHAEELGATFIADGRDEVLTAVRENLRFGATQIKMMAGGGAATLYDPLDVSQYTLDELKAGVEAAADWGTYVTVHAYTTRAVRRAVEAGVLCIEHGQLLDEDTIRLLGEKGVFLSLQALDPAPPGANPFVAAKKKLVIDGTDNAFRWAKKYGVKLLWGTDFLFDPKQNVRQAADILKLKQWFTPAEALALVTSGNAKVFALSGERNPYRAGPLGEISEGAYADLVLVEGNPLQDFDLIGDPSRNFKVIIKDGKVWKNTLR